MGRALPIVLAAGLAALAAGCGGGSSGTTAGPPEALLHPAALDARAPASFDVRFVTTQGSFTVAVHRAWAPHGADRVYDLVKARFYDGTALFRVVKGFVVQFGISPYPAVSRAWESATIADDPPRAPNARGAVTFAAAGPDTRTTQLFVNLGDNRSLDGQGFAPIGRVVAGMAVVDTLYGGYGEAPAEKQLQMLNQGDVYLKKAFPKLDRIVSARIVR